MNWRSRPLVFSLLPCCQGAWGSSEPDVDLQSAGQFGVVGHFRPTTTRHVFAERDRQPFHLSGEAVENRLGAVAVHLAQNDEAGLALDQSARRGTIERALDQVTFPVSGHQTHLDFLRSVDHPR